MLSKPTIQSHDVVSGVIIVTYRPRKLRSEYLGAGGFHDFFLSSISAAETSKSRINFAKSIMIVSPVFTSAIGPPTWASGTTWPIMMP